MRNYAQLNIAIWNDDDFRALTPQAQHLYFLLLSHPTLSYCGVGDWRPKRLASMAAGWTAQDVERAGAELIDRLFIVVDEDTEEFLVRTFVKNDPLMRQRNLGVSMARAFSLVASEGIRGVVVWELTRLAEARPGLKGLDSDEVAQVLAKPSIDPSVYPSGNPSIDPSVKGSVDPSPTPAPTPPPLQLRESSKEREDGGKGGSGEKGETNATQSTGEIEPPPEHFESLNALADAHAKTHTTAAYGTPDDPRCEKHKNLPRDQVPACFQCKKAGDILTTRAESQKQSRREAIANCDLCDDNGMYDTGNGLARCTHQPQKEHTPPWKQHA